VQAPLNCEDSIDVGTPSLHGFSSLGGTPVTFGHFFLCEAKYISSRNNPVVQKMTACFSLILLTYVPKNGLHHCLSAN
jgi:hypothetical protein